MKKYILLISFMSCAMNLFAQTITGVTDVCVGSVTTLANDSLGGTWSSASTAIATIGTTGNVTGVSAGTSVITYFYSGGGYITATVTVNPIPAAISGSGSVCQGQNTLYSDVTTGGSWSSSNNLVAMVDAVTGVVTGVSIDTATIYYTLLTGCYRSAGIIINEMPVPITGSANFCVGVTDSLYESGGGTWTTASTGIISLGATAGNITGLAAGTAVVTYTLSTGCATTMAITVNPLPVAGTITASSFVCLGSTTTCASDKCCGVWSSSNSAIATINPTSGVATGVGAGIITINYAVTNYCGTANAISALQVLSVDACNKLSVDKTKLLQTELAIVPNPATDGHFTVTLNSGKEEQATVTITTITGEKVKVFTTATNKKNEVKLDSAAGMYFISAVTESGKYEAKVILE